MPEDSSYVIVGVPSNPIPAERLTAGENPIDEHNHALGALGYFSSRLDYKFMWWNLLGEPGPAVPNW
jgi:hypothetical protein